MRKQAFLQAFALFLCLMLPLSVLAGHSEAYTARQLEILQGLRSIRPQGREGTGVWMLSAWDTDSGLGGVFAFPENFDNAASRFRMLEDLYPSEKDELERDGVETKGVSALLEAAEMGVCRLSPDYYPEFDSMTAKQPDFMVMRLYLAALLRRGGKAEQLGRRDEAERCFRAAIMCGRHLTRDKSSAMVFITGLIFKLRGSQGYAAYLHRVGRNGEAAAMDSYIASLTEVLRLCDWKNTVALGELKDFACLPSVMEVAVRDSEAFWRKEAVARLAILRHGVPESDMESIVRNNAFERLAQGALEAASRDSDPTVRRMAVWAALNVRPGNYEAMRHLF